MAKQEKSGAATTASSRTELTTKEVMKHIKKLQNAKSKLKDLEMKALQPAIAAIDEEITKAKAYAIKQLEKELNAE